MGNRTWESNAAEFGALTKQGMDVRLALLVACSVEKAKPGSKIVTNVRILKCSATEFAERADTSAPRVLRHLKAWDDCAVQGWCAASSGLTPADAADPDLAVPTQEQFEQAFDASKSGSRPRDSKPEHAAEIIEKRGAQAVVDAMTPKQRVQVAKEILSDQETVTDVEEATGLAIVPVPVRQDYQRREKERAAAKQDPLEVELLKLLERISTFMDMHPDQAQRISDHTVLKALEVQNGMSPTQVSKP